MANTVLQSIGRLNQYLSLEVARKRKDDKEALVNRTGADVAAEFQSLGPNATQRDVSQAMFRAVSKAGKAGALPENIALISGLGRQSSDLSRYEREQDQSDILAARLDKTSPYNLSGMEGDTALKFLGARTATQVDKVVDEGDTSYWKRFNQTESGEFKSIAEINLGPSQQALLDQKGDIAASTARARWAAKYGAKGASVADLNTTIKTHDKMANDQAINLLRQLDPAMDADKLSKQVGGAKGYLQALLKNPARMQEVIDTAVEDYKLPGMTTESGGETFTNYTTALRYKGTSFTDKGGTTIPDATLIPLALDKEFMEFIYNMDVSQAASDQMVDQVISGMQDVNSVDMSTQIVIKNKAMNEIDAAFANPTADPEMTSLFEDMVRDITGNPNDPIAEVWASSPKQVRDMITIQLVNFAVGESKKKSQMKDSSIRRDKPLTPAIRNNNPGNIRAINGNFRKFESIEEGHEAMIKDITKKLTGNSKHSHRITDLKSLIMVYAPASDGNNLDDYLHTVEQMTGYKPDTLISNMNANVLVKGMIKHEDRNMYDIIFKKKE